jgi:hypothetical protein
MHPPSCQKNAYAPCTDRAPIAAPSTLVHCTSRAACAACRLIATLHPDDGASSTQPPDPAVAFIVRIPTMQQYFFSNGQTMPVHPAIKAETLDMMTRAEAFFFARIEARLQIGVSITTEQARVYDAILLRAIRRKPVDGKAVVLV